MREKASGITLIALVVTIVVLLILAGITMNLLLSDTGLLGKAQQAENAWRDAENSDINAIGALGNQVNELLSGTGGGSTPDDPTKGPNGKPLVETATEIQTESNLEAEDEYGNPVVVPKGFKVVVDETTNNATTVAEGIVIEDEAGNQFVWIPTGIYKVDESGTTKINELTRRQWGTTANVEQVPTPITGDGVAAGYNGNQCYYGEGDERSIAHDTIDNFLNSAKPTSEGGNGGFYIGRYEQGEGNVCKAKVDAYVDVTRDTAKAQAEAMYTDKEQYGVTSELISSYAWDTALNFICQNSEHGYTLATTTDDTYGNIGTSNKTQTGRTPEDCYSNIYDILGNCAEWTTEYSSGTYDGIAGPCVDRGSHCDSSTHYAAGRYYDQTGSSSSYAVVSFRLSLYV